MERHADQKRKKAAAVNDSYNGHLIDGHDSQRRDRGSPSSCGTVNYRGWLAGVVGWDGILRVCVLATPQVARYLGADQSLTELLSITAPLLAFFVRIPVGCRRIAKNHGGPILRCCQFTVFFLAAVLLVCIDTLMLVAMEMYNDRLWANEADLVAWTTLLSVYFLAMLFALYPGRSPQPPSDVSATEPVGPLLQ